MTADTTAKTTAAATTRVKKSAKPARKAPESKSHGRLVDRQSHRPSSGKSATDAITSKADLIRKVAGIIQAKGEQPRPADIVRILQEEGVTVAPAQVSMTLKAAGYRPLRKRRKEGKAADGGARHASNAGATGSISLDDLLAAKSVSGAFGSTDKAIAALQALKQLES